MKDQNSVLTNKHTDWDYFNYLLESNFNLSVMLKAANRLEKYLPREIKNLTAEKHILRRKWHQARNPHDKNLLNRVSQQLSKEIKNIKQSSLKFLTELTPDISSEYSLSKFTTLPKKTNSSRSTHKKKMRDGLITT
jgi:hypothetical protein